RVHQRHQHNQQHEMDKAAPAKSGMETTMKFRKMMWGTRACFTVAASLAVGYAVAETADQWPQRAITWIVGYAPGGSTDVIARTVAAKVSEELGQTVIVQNKPGANSNIGAVAVKRSDPDGYTFYV